MGRRVRKNHFGLGCAFFVACGFIFTSYNQLVMLSFLLHFYQPSNQLPEVLKDIVKNCYAPLLKVIKENKKLNLTMNIPLALLEQLDRLGYSNLIEDIKLLADQGRVELTGTGAYHPLLSKLPEEMVYKQIALNELAYGYYFGTDKDFEGEDCYMIKDVRGFFPPEMAINESLLKVLSDMGYEWVLLDEYALPEIVRKSHQNGTYYALSNYSAKVLVRNRGLSNLLAFNRDFNVSATAEDIKRNGDNAILALDAETFGHHYKDGVGFFDNLMRELAKMGVEFGTISQALKYMEEKPVSAVLESTWSTVDADIYSMWVNEENPVNKALWDLFDFIHSRAVDLVDLIGSGESSRTGVLGNAPKPRPLWLEGSGYSEDSLLLNTLKSEQSDAFWWSAGADIAGKKNISKHMVLSVLEYYRGCAGLFGPEVSEVLKRIKQVEKEGNLLE